jgi:nucleoside-diphosphate-sugar epimerase
MLYLVTGGCGFIGSNLVNFLIDNKHEVIVIDNLSTGNIINKNVTLIEGDITDYNVFKKLNYKFNGIFHLAAMSKVLPSLENKEMIEFCANNNIIGTINVLKYASSFDPPLKVIYSASSTCYGDNEIPNTENQLPDCQTPYALSKYVGELYCNLFSKLYKVPTIRLRYFMVFGPGEPSNGSYAVVTGIFKKNKLENKPLIIHGDGKQTRDFVHVNDIAEANLKAMESEYINETINVGTGQMVSIKELADLISENQIHTEPRKHDLKNTLADCSKILKLFKWKPTITIQSSL